MQTHAGHLLEREAEYVRSLEHRPIALPVPLVTLLSYLVIAGLAQAQLDLIGQLLAVEAGECFARAR